MNLEDLEKAIDILYNPQNHSAQVNQQAQQYCDSFAQNNAANLIDFFKLYVQNQNEMTRFWLLHAIVDIVKLYYDQVMLTQEQRQQIHEIYIQLLKEYPTLILGQKHSLSKYALIFIMLLRHDFPHLWQDAFQQLLQIISTTQEATLQQQYMNLFIKIMLTFEEEFVERQEQRNQIVLEINSKVKDGVRQLAINDIIFILTQALMNYQFFEEEIINEALQVMAQLIDWNQLELFAQTIDLFKGFIEMNQYRRNAIKCLHSIVHKGMDYYLKIELIANIQFMDLLESFQIKYRERTDDSDIEEQGNEEEFFFCVAESLDKLGQWCLELFMKQDKLLPTQEHQQQYELIFNRTLRIALNLLDTDKPKIGRPIIEFLTQWLQNVKKLEEINDFYRNMLTQLFEILVKRIRYPDWCTFQEGSVLSEHEEEYNNFRDELVNVFINIAGVKPFHETLLNLLAQLFQSINPVVTPFNQAEVPLFLAYNLHQAIPANMKESNNNSYCQLMQYILKIDFINYDHKIVSLMLLENLVRYSSYFLQNPNFSAQIASIFFSSKAIYSSEPQLASRSCYLLFRLCEKIQNQIINQAYSIIEAAFQVIQRVEQGSPQEHIITYDDLQYLYNIIGLFAANQNLDLQTRQKVVDLIMGSLYERLINCQQQDKDKIIWILKFINVFIKCLNTHAPQEMKESLAKVLQASLNIMGQNLKNIVIGDQVLQLLQRNVQLLGVDVIPYINEIAQPYIQNIEFERQEVFLTILNYCFHILKHEATPLLEFLLLFLFQKISQVNIPSSDLSDIEKINIKTFLAFFKLISTAIEVDSTFLFSTKNKPYFVDFFNYLIAHFQQNIDRNTKKMIAFIFRDMFIDFSGLKMNPQNLTQFTKRNHLDPITQLKDTSIVTDFPVEYQLFVEQVLLIATQSVFTLSITQVEEVSIIKILAEIQALYVLAGYSEQLVAAIALNCKNIQVQQQIFQLCQQFALKQILLKPFQDNYIKILSQVNHN